MIDILNFNQKNNGIKRHDNTAPNHILKISRLFNSVLTGEFLSNLN